MKRPQVSEQKVTALEKDPLHGRGAVGDARMGEGKRVAVRSARYFQWPIGHADINSWPVQHQAAVHILSFQLARCAERAGLCNVEVDCLIDRARAERSVGCEPLCCGVRSEEPMNDRCNQWRGNNLYERLHDRKVDVVAIGPSVARLGVVLADLCDVRLQTMGKCRRTFLDERYRQSRADHGEAIFVHSRYNGVHVLVRGIEPTVVAPARLVWAEPPTFARFGRGSV